MKLESILYQMPSLTNNIDRTIENKQTGRKIDIVHRFGYDGQQNLTEEQIKLIKNFSDGYKGFTPHAEKWIVQKWADPDGEIGLLQKKGYDLYNIIMKTGKTPYEIHIGHSIFPIVKLNGMLNEGINEVFDLVDGTDTTNRYTNALARVGCGNGTTAFSATHTALQGASTAFSAMDATYPTSATQKINLKGTFLTGTAEFAWEEGTADNGATPNHNLNRVVQSKGTKPSGETWTSEVEITGS